jgi:hypothetical protein
MLKKLSFVIVALFIAAIIHNCDDAGQVQDEGKYTISGTIESWTMGSDKKLRAIVTDSSGTNTFIADSTTIGSNGDFTLNMKSPGDNFFYQYTIPSGTSCTNGVAISPSNLKSVAVQFKVYNSSNNYIGKIERKNYNALPVTGSFSVNYLHFNTNGSVLGDLTCNNTTDTIYTNFNLVCTNSWKPVIAFADSINVSYTYQRWHFNHTEPSGAAWKFSP